MGAEGAAAKRTPAREGYLHHTETGGLMKQIDIPVETGRLPLSTGPSLAALTARPANHKDLQGALAYQSSQFSRLPLTRAFQLVCMPPYNPAREGS